MVMMTERWGTAVGAGLCAIFSLGGCAGGESETIGGVSLTAGFSGDDGGQATTDPDSSPTTGGTMESESSGQPPTSVSASASTTDPSTDSASSGPETTGPGLPCTLAEDCDDGDPCTEDNCLNSECSNAETNCDDSIDCTVDSCDPITGACVHAPNDMACDDADLCTGTETCSAATGCSAGQPVMCSDGVACTVDSCNPATGACGFVDIEACTSGDGCCPVGCSVADTDCTCTNLALTATPSSSGGWSNLTGYGPNNWVDGDAEDSCDATCNQCFGWVENSPTASGAWMQLDWGTPRTIGSMFIDGIGPGGCQAVSRGLAGGTIQWWSGVSWVDAQTFSGATGDLQFSFNPPLQTTRLRIFNAVAPPGGVNSLAFEWYAFEPLGCTP